LTVGSVDCDHTRKLAARQLSRRFGQDSFRVRARSIGKHEHLHDAICTDPGRREHKDLYGAECGSFEETAECA
jgi:hypothetical protein